MSYNQIELDFDRVLKDTNIRLSARTKSLSINVLNLSTRTFNALDNKDVKSIKHLLMCKLAQLKATPNLGKNSIIEIFNAVNKIDDNSFYLIESFGFSKNTLKLLKSSGVHNIDQLKHFDWNSLLVVPYYGKKVVNEISEFIKEYNEDDLSQPNSQNEILKESIDILDFELNKKILFSKLQIQTIKDFLQHDFDINNAILDQSECNYFNYIKQGLFQKIDSAYNFRSIADLVCGKDPIKGIKDNNRYLSLKLRLKGDITLEAAGAKVNVTRERIRQLELKAIKKLTYFLPEIHVELLMTKMSVHEPTYINMLMIKNNYFEGIEEYLDAGGSFIKAIFDHEFSHIQYEKFDNNIVLSRKGLKIKDVVSEIENQNLKPEAIDSYISLLGRSDAKKLILKDLEKNKPKSTRGRTKLAIKEIFDESRELLPTNKLITLLKDNYDISTHTNVVNDAIANNQGIYLFGKNGWGHEKYFRKIDDKELKIIAPELIEILILSKGSQRGRIGLLKELKSHVKDKANNLSNIVKKLSAHDIDWILNKVVSEYPKLQNLGRGNWIWSNKSQERITMGHAALKVLEESGKPLAASELEKRVTALRGVSNSQFQLRTNRNRPELIQLESEIHGQGNFTMWGLRDRDLPISKENQDMLFELICNKFHEGQKYIELHELEKMIEICGFDDNISTLQIIRMLHVYTANSDRDNEYFSIKFGKRHIPTEGIFKLENRIKYSYKDFNK